MKRSIYVDATLVHAASVSHEHFVATALRLGYDNVKLAARMEWLKEQPADYRLKVMKAVSKIGKQGQDDSARNAGPATTPESTDQTNNEVGGDGAAEAGRHRAASPADNSA